METSYQRLRKRLAAHEAVTEAAINLHVEFKKARREDAPAVVAAKAALLQTLVARDGDLGAAVEKALKPLGMRRQSLWVDMAGAEETATYRVAIGKQRKPAEPVPISKERAAQGVEQAIETALHRRRR